MSRYCGIFSISNARAEIALILQFIKSLANLH